jgi:hypothetical protein
MHDNQRPRYLPPADTIRQNRTAVRARARARARIENIETRATIAAYRAGAL